MVAQEDVQGWNMNILVELRRQPQPGVKGGGLSAKYVQSVFKIYQQYVVYTMPLKYLYRSLCQYIKIQFKRKDYLQKERFSSRFVAYK